MMRKPKKDFRLALRKSLLKKMDMTMPKSERMLLKDPYLRLGFGMGAYFETIKYLMWMMLFIFLCMMPVMYIYKGFNGIKYDAMGVVTQFSLGNMGGAGVVCKQVPFEENSVLSMKCKSGLFNA